MEFMKKFVVLGFLFVVLSFLLLVEGDGVYIGINY